MTFKLKAFGWDYKYFVTRQTLFRSWRDEKPSALMSQNGRDSAPKSSLYPHQRYLDPHHNSDISFSGVLIDQSPGNSKHIRNTEREANSTKTANRGGCKKATIEWQWWSVQFSYQLPLPRNHKGKHTALRWAQRRRGREVERRTCTLPPPPSWSTAATWPTLGRGKGWTASTTPLKDSEKSFPTSTLSRCVYTFSTINTVFSTWFFAEDEQDRDAVGGADIHQGLGEADGLRGGGGGRRDGFEDQSSQLA